MSETNTPPPARLVGRLGRIVPRGEWATLANDPMRTLFGKRIPLNDALLATRGQGRGLALYSDLERDGTVGACLQKRRDAVVGREWQLEAADESPAAQQALEVVQEALDGIPFNLAVGEMLDALNIGISVLEILWAVRGNLVVPAGLPARNPGRFTFHDSQAGPVLRLLTKAQRLDGEDLPDRKFILHRHGAKYGDPWGGGLGQRLFWPVFFKRQGIAFWLGALEKFGQPTVVGKYPAGTSDAEQDKLLDALRAISSEAAVAIPEGMVAELLEAKRSGTFDSYEKLCRYMDEQISMIVLGETLSTSVGASGSRALGEVHNEVRLEIAQGDADRLSDTLNSGLIRWITEFNGFPAEAAPRLWWDMSPAEDLTKTAERDGKIAALGFRPLPEYIQATYGEGWVENLAAPRGQSALPANAPGPGSVPGMPLPAFAEGPDAQDAPSRLAGELDRAARGAQERMIEQIRAEVLAAKDLPDLADRLAALYPRMPAAPMAEVMAQALSLASLEGRAALLPG